jgi:hypothetical protein
VRQDAQFFADGFSRRHAKNFNAKAQRRKGIFNGWATRRFLAVHQLAQTEERHRPLPVYWGFLGGNVCLILNWHITYFTFGSNVGLVL